MVFYDPKDKRKRYLRTFSVVLTVAILGSLASLALGAFFVLNENASAAGAVDIGKMYEYYRTPLNDKKIALTFDDGPHRVFTPAVISILKKHNIPATFFFVGGNVLKHPDIARDVSMAGFEIGNHTFTHSSEVHNSLERLNDELRITGKIIEVTTGQAPLFYRPPFLLDIGDDPTINLQSEGNLKPLLVALENGYISVGADIDSKDWLVSSPEELVGNVLADSDSGHIVLLHDGGHGRDSDYMLPILEKMISDLKSEGYEFVSLRELFFPPTAIALTHELRLGSTDAATDQQVSLLQWFLYTEGLFDPALIGGSFGPKTEEALVDWQKKYEADTPAVSLALEYGVVGENTKKAVAAAYAQNTAVHLPPPSALGVPESAVTRVQRASISSAALIFAMSKYLLWLVIALVLGRLLSILAIYLFSLLRRQNSRQPARLPLYGRGVSVLIPAYNEQENIESSILSVLRNDYKNKEVIVINDGSTDNTGQVVENMQSRYPGKIKLINLPNGGKANALNTGIEFAKHSIFISMDADTIFAPDTIKNLVWHFSNESVGAVAGKVQTTRSKNWLDIFQSIEYAVGQNIEKEVFSSVNAVGVVPGPVGAWRKSAVLAAGGYSRETLVEDQDLTLSVLLQGYKILYDPRAVAYTETPHTLDDFLKQRFRWIYGTFQCAWKHRARLFENPTTSFSLVIMPNILLFSLVAPLFFPLIDALFILTILFGSWQKALLMYAAFTAIDTLYAALAFQKEKRSWKQLVFVPIQRLYYRQILYYVVARSILRAVEGNEEFWNKVVKNGESQKYYLSNFENVVISKN